MNDVELLSGQWRNPGVNAVRKISEQLQCAPPDQEHDHAHDSAPDHDLRDDFKHFVNGVRVAHLIPLIPFNQRVRRAILRLHGQTASSADGAQELRDAPRGFPD